MHSLDLTHLKEIAEDLESLSEAMLNPATISWLWTGSPNSCSKITMTTYFLPSSTFFS